MSAGTDEIWQAIERADGMPHGRARVAELEELVRWLDDVPAPGPTGLTGLIDLTGLVEQPAWADPAIRAELGTAVRVSLIPACLHGGEHQRVPALLAWLLEQYDESPSWFGPWERHSVLFCFTWATVGLLQHPDVPLAHLERLLADMAARYEAAGESMAPVLRARFLFTRHVHGAQAATADFEAWRAAGRSELSECEECELAEQVSQFTALGRHQEAVALALPVLDGRPVAGCATQPLAMIGAALEPLLATGQADRAAAEHVRAVRMLRTIRPDAAAADLGRADHLLACARSGRLQRGLDLLQEWLPWFTTVEPPINRLETAAAAGRMLRGLAEAGHGQLLLSAEGVDPTSGDALGARLAHEARDLGSRFDARNGTSTIGDRVEQVLEAAALPDLPLDAFSRARRGLRVAARPAPGRRGRRVAVQDTPHLLASAPEADLVQAFNEAMQADSDERCEAILNIWRQRRNRPAAARDEPAAARLDGVLTLADLSRPGPDDPTRHQAALAAVALATERLRLAGLITEARLHEQAALLAAAQAGRMDLATAVHRIEQLTAELTAGAAQTAADADRTRPVGSSTPSPGGTSVTAAGATVRITVGKAPRTTPPARTPSPKVSPGAVVTPGDLGVALSRLVLIRELAAELGLGADPTADLGQRTGQGGDPLDAGLAALSSVPSNQLDHHQLRAVARLLRIRAKDEPGPQAIRTLRAAVAVLPDGVRPVERALAGADLAAALEDTAPAAALLSWDQAIADAALAGGTGVLAGMLAASANLRAILGDPAGAAEDLLRAVPLLDEHDPGPLAAQARLDLSLMLLLLGRSFEAAEVAEAGLSDLTELLRAENVTAADLDGGGRPVRPRSGPDPESGGGRAEVHLAGCLAFTAAEANSAVGAEDSARELALRSADWHRVNGNLIAQSEAWELAARLGGPPARIAADFGRAAELADTAGDWVRAATCRRERIIALKDAEGTDAALAALTQAEALLRAREDSPAGRHAPQEEQQKAGRQLRWHRLAVAEQRARLLAVSGRFAEAMRQVDGLEKEYYQLGDAWSARDLLGLRGQLRAELDDLEGALADLRRAAEEAEAAGDPAQAHGLGERLAAVLAQAGRPGEAEQAWKRFAGPA